jgi:antitoxin ParD1/3/4
MPMSSMNISLPEELKAYVEEQTARGYSTPSEFVRELIRQDRKRRARERLEGALLEGLDSGAPVPADKKFWADLQRDVALAVTAKKKLVKAAKAK